MTRTLLGRWGLLSGVGGPVLLLQGGCTIDPDIYLRMAMQLLTEVGIFALDNLVVALR